MWRRAPPRPGDLRSIARCALRHSRAALALAFAATWIGGDAVAAPAKCTLVKIAEWAVRPGTGAPIVDGAINGQKVGILLDTGARTHILRPAAFKLGLVRYTDRRDRAVGIGGETAVESVSVDSFAIGDTVRRNWGMTVVGETDFGGDITALLGEDFFHQAEVEFDLPHNAVRMFQAKDCADVALAYWSTGGAGEVRLEDYSEARPAIELTVEINGRPVAAMLDSGAFRSVLTRAQAAAFGVTPESNDVVAAGCSRGLGSKAIEKWSGTFETFAIGNEIIRHPRIQFADVFRYSTYAQTGSLVKQSLPHPDMLLGADFLRAHRVLIAHSQRKMYFTYVGGTVFRAGSPARCDESQPRDVDSKSEASRK